MCKIVSSQSTIMYIHDSDVCTICNLNVCGDEYHYVLIFLFFKVSRTMYFKALFLLKANFIETWKLFSLSSRKTISNLPKLANMIFYQC